MVIPRLNKESYIQAIFTSKLVDCHTFRGLSRKFYFNLIKMSSHRHISGNWESPEYILRFSHIKNPQFGVYKVLGNKPYTYCYRTESLNAAHCERRKKIEKVLIKILYYSHNSVCHCAQLDVNNNNCFSLLFLYFHPLYKQ